MSLEITACAAHRIKEILEEQNVTDGGLRVGVKSGGCSGLSYILDLDSQQRPGDKVFERDGAKIFVDLKSYLFLNGMIVDYKDEGGLMGRGFKFVNPNSMGECGCGESFAV
ncbi:MAG: iron-sulfur cluster assembly accessory protein [Acidobacteria bacterium]|nr:iron-sulfur cluster assembly accessory protein [Acidobacteriota bacterium]